MNVTVSLRLFLNGITLHCFYESQPKDLSHVIQTIWGSLSLTKTCSDLNGETQKSEVFCNDKDNYVKGHNFWRNDITWGI